MSDSESLLRTIREQETKISILEKQRDKVTNDYLKLYSKNKEATSLIKDLIKKNKYQIETETYKYISLDTYSDLKEILDILERV